MIQVQYCIESYCILHILEGLDDLSIQLQIKLAQLHPPQPARELDNQNQTTNGQ